MRPGKAPEPITVGKVGVKRLVHDRQVVEWARRLAGDETAKPIDLDEEQLVYVFTEVLKRRGDEFSPTLFEDAMVKTTPVVVAPEITDWVDDLSLILQQPEMIDFWALWRGPQGQRGPRISYHHAKASLAVLSMFGRSSRVCATHDELENRADLREMFGKHERLVATLHGTPAGSFDEITPFKSLMRHKDRIAPGLFSHAMDTNIHMVRALAQLLPGRGIGERLMIDGTAIPAWVPQKGAYSSDPEVRHRIDQRLRGRCPQAGFRAYTYTKKGKKALRASGNVRGESIFSGATRKWRGYTLIVIADQATGLPLVWTLQDAADKEADAIIPLLSDLYQRWPDIPATLIAGDSAWDTDQYCEFCETRYGLHPIFRRRENTSAKLIQPGDTQYDRVARTTKYGQLVCRRHGKPVPYETVETPSRGGTRPGRIVKGNYRVRGRCKHGPHPCGRIGLAMEFDWSALTSYPHFSDGSPKRFAMRQAMLVRLNGIESIFNRLKSRNVGTAGTDRSRLISFDTQQAIISLSLLGMTALTLADQRSRNAPIEKAA